MVDDSDGEGVVMVMLMVDDGGSKFFIDDFDEFGVVVVDEGVLQYLGSFRNCYCRD